MRPYGDERRELLGWPMTGNSPPNSTPRRFSSYLLLYFLFIFYLPRCILPDFPSVSSLASLPFFILLSSNNNKISILVSRHVSNRDAVSYIYFYLVIYLMTFSMSLYTQRIYFRNLIKSTRNQIVYTIFRLIWNQMVVRLSGFQKIP